MSKVSLEQIQRQFPDLVVEAAKAQMEFDLVFKSSYGNIERELRNLLGEKWNEYRNQLRKQLTHSLASTTISREQAAAFVKDVMDRAKGQIESPILETFLTFNPKFQNNPAEEFLYGFTRTYRTKDHAKAKGIDFQIQYPASWRGKEGQRPNVIQIITSENGRGLDSIVLIIKDIPLPRGYQITEKELDDLFSPQSLKEMVPEGASFLSAKPIILDRRKGSMLVFEQMQQRLDITVKMRGLQFVTIYENKMILIQCLTGKITDSSTDLNERFRRIEPLFKLIGNSFVLQSQRVLKTR